MKLKRYQVLVGIITMLSSSLLFSQSTTEESLGKEINITVPKPIKPVSPVRIITHKSNEDILNRSIGFSKRYPPNYTPLKDRLVKKLEVKEGKVGEPVNGRISVNLIGDLMKTKEVKAKLINAGFEIVKVYHITKRRSLVSIVFTNSKLKELASRTNRGFAGTLRVLIDKKDKIIAIHNPMYVTKAFLQDDFDKKLAEDMLSAITKEFPSLKNSLDKSKFQSLPKYQFMDGMPFYKDMVEVANGSDLLDKLKDNKRVLFVMNLDKDSTLVGVRLSKRTKKFPKKIGLTNAGLLPYPVLIEGGKAKILDPKYYISVMYPNLKMEEFMKIATTPEAIVKDCSRVFR